MISKQSWHTNHPARGRAPYTLPHSGRTFRITIVYIIIAVALMLVGCSGNAPPAVPNPTPGNPEPTLELPSEINLMPIEAVEVQVGESDPIQVVVQIRGSLVDACTSFHTLTQSRQGNTIEITVTTIRPKASLCAQRITPYATTVVLDGPLPKGAYLVRVNGVERAFAI